MHLRVLRDLNRSYTTTPSYTFLLRWHACGFIGKAGLRNVRTCTAEQEPPYFRGPTHVCQKIMRSKLHLSKNEVNNFRTN